MGLGGVGVLRDGDHLDGELISPAHVVVHPLAHLRHRLTVVQVGYGDYVPTWWGSQLFTIVFTVFGIIFIFSELAELVRPFALHHEPCRP